MFKATVSSTSPRVPPVHAPLSDPFTQQDPFLPSAKRHRQGSIGRSGDEGTGRLHNDNRSVAWSAGISGTFFYQYTDQSPGVPGREVLHLAFIQHPGYKSVYEG